MRLLVVEDEPDLAQILKQGLEEESYSVDLCMDGEEALFMATEIAYDGIVLDILLPKLDGLSVLRKLRQSGKKTPVLMLTAKDTVQDKITGLDGGADDYLCKPFVFEELLARLRALLRRNVPEKSTLITVRDREMDTAKKTVRRGGKPITLTAKEYVLLEYIVFNKNRVLTRTELTEHIYNDDFDLDSNVIEVFISILRKKSTGDTM